MIRRRYFPSWFIGMNPQLLNCCVLQKPGELDMPDRCEGIATFVEVKTRYIEISGLDELRISCNKSDAERSIHLN